ncbi:MAG: hypothetical protein LBD96_09265 [Treponema sp.]|nr:hypothetical protein [Treponema sp.]
MNPIDFNPEDFTLNVNVTGSIKIEDVAVTWLINRTKTVNVVSYTIDRVQAGNETDDQYVYPKNYGSVPFSTGVYASSSASYHTPTEIPYTITVVCEDTADNNQPYIFGPFNVQFPRAQDYKYYLYWTTGGQLVLVEEDKMTDLPPDPEDNFPDPQPSSVNAQTFVVLNVTPDKNLTGVEFVKAPYIYVLANEPRAKDQEMILLASGSYDVKAYYAGGETPSRTAIVTKEDGSMAVRTNFLYFYKTNTGTYDLSQYWPPLANDAAEGNKPEDALLDSQGILEIRNNAVANNPHALIARININGTEYPDSTNTTSYFAPGDPPLRYILPVGSVDVMFRPMDQTYYGQVSRRSIQSKTVTVLSYINDLGNPFAFPEGTGKGSGLVRITNNSTALVTSIAVYNKTDVTNSLSIGYENFNPPQPVNYGKVGLVPVVGTDLVPLNSGEMQLIQVVLETTGGTVVLERLAALNNQIVDIVIAEANLNPGGTGDGGRYGSKVTVRNQTTTPTKILGMYVYNVANEANMAIYSLDIANPDGQASLDVLSTIGLPIVEGADYKAKVVVHGNGLTGIIHKEFDPDNKLYSTTPESHERFITLTQADLETQAPGLIETFVPVTGVEFDSNPYTMQLYTESDPDGSNPAVITAGALNAVNLKNLVKKVLPDTATTKGPIVWGSVTGPGSSYVDFNPSTAVLRVTGIAPQGSTLNVEFGIENAVGTVTSKTAFTGDLEINLNYTHIRYRDAKVTSFTIAGGVEIEEGKTLSLNSLVSLNPALPYSGGLPITASDLTWSIVSTGTTSTGSSISAGTLTAGTAGTVKVQATMPASKTSSGSAISVQQTITITQGNNGHVNITRISADSPVIPFYTRNAVVGGVKKKIVYTGGELYLQSSLRFTLDNATVKAPVRLSIVDGFGAYQQVGLIEVPSGSSWVGSNNLMVRQNVLPSNGGDRYLLLAEGVPIPETGDQVKVRVTIPNANWSNGSLVNYVQPLEEAIIVTLLEVHYANSIVDLPEDFSVTNAGITKGETIDLKNLTYLASGTYTYSGTMYPITEDDLTWTIKTGGGSGSLSGSKLTGTNAGTVTVTVTLPAAKNNGDAISRDITITVKDPPAVTPSTFTLRIIRPNTPNQIDKIKQVVLVPVDNHTYSAAVLSTGYTGVRWNYTTKYISTVAEFKEMYPDNGSNRYYTLSTESAGDLGDEDDWADISVPWPAGNGGYYIFFVEADGHVRSYCKASTKPSPAWRYPAETDFLFFIHPDTLYEYNRLPMYMSKADGYKRAPTDIGVSYQEVIPIGYDDIDNVPTIMLDNGVGNRLNPNYPADITRWFK